MKKLNIKENKNVSIVNKIVCGLIKNSVYLVSVINYAIYVVIRAINNLVVKLFNKLPRLIRVLIIYALISGNIFMIINLDKIVIVQKVQQVENQVIETITENIETTEKVENKPIIEEQKTETKQDNTCKLKKDIECKIYNKGIEKGLTKEQSLLLVAISKHETGKWTSKAFKEKHNFGGIMSSSTGQLKVYKNQNEGLEGFVNLLKTKYFEKGLNTIEKIGAKYCPVGSKNDTGVNKYWIPNVTQFYNEYLQQM